MAFEGLADKLGNAFKKLKNKGKLSEKDVKEAMREVRLALLEADVNYKVAKDFTNKVTERAVGQDVMQSLTPAQMVVKIVDEELTSLMGGEDARIEFASKPPTVIMMCGLQGSGKTTHTAKLAKMLKKQGRNPLLAACDVYRPAAIDQLKVVGEKAGVPVFEMGKANPVKIAKEAIKRAKDYGNDVVILDTAGRLHIDEALMDELKNIKKEVEPNEILLVIDSMTGQDAVNVAKSFNELLDITGVILTKLDDIEVFHPDRMASRILGMGDVLTLIEDAQNKMDAEKAEEMAQKMMSNKFDFNDLYDQFEQVKKMGPLKGILSKIPGVGKQLEGVDIDDRQIDWVQAIILSMTPEERSHPHIMNPSRKRRIAAGSGRSIEEVNRLIKQIDQMQKMMRQMTKGGKGSKKRRKMKGLPGLGGMPMNGMGPAGGMGGPDGMPPFK